jgi:hypothetical protein
LLDALVINSVLKSGYSHAYQYTASSRLPGLE